jgi:cytochrome c
MPGLAVNIYQLDFQLYGFPQIREKMMPQETGVINMLHAYPADFEEKFGAYTENFAIQIRGYLNIQEDATFQFRLASNDGSRIYIRGDKKVETVGNWSDVQAEDTVHLKAGKHPFIYEFYDRGGPKKFSMQWRLNDDEEFSVIPPEVFTFSSSDLKEVKPQEVTVAVEKQPVPGDGTALDKLHPSFDLAQARPESFQPKVSGLDFMSDGRLVVTTWDSLGAVYILDGVQGEDPNSIKVKRVAAGLAEPLGLKVVDDEIYVLQKQELTKLVDLNGDEIADEYQTVCNSWSATSNHHEFAFGLVYRDGYFYGTLSLAIEGPGPSAPVQAPDRGKAFKISIEDGSITYPAHGLRTPNGIGFGVDNEIFIADNQGDWLPANKIIHLKEGAFYGNRSSLAAGEEKPEEPPVVYLEHDKVGNSPSQPANLNVGPWQNQMIHGDVTHGGIKRVFAEKVKGSYQGVVFRFTQGLEAGVNRLAWGPDGSLYVGGIGNGGNWGQYGKLRYGLQKLTYNGKPVFEMLAVRAKPTGIEIEFTEPLKEGVGVSKSDYTIKQWWYDPTANYGGPNMDVEPLEIGEIKISPDRKRVTLELPEMKEGHVVYIRLNRDAIVSSGNRNLWTTEAWYAMNNIP